MNDGDNRPEIKCPKHSTGGGPCYCGKTPSVAESEVEELAGSEALMLFSQRLTISKQIDAWYEQHPQAHICNLNAVTALVSLGYKVGKWEFNSAEELDHYRMAAESEAKRGDELAARVDRLEQLYDDAAILGLYTVSFDSGASHKALCRLTHKVRSEPRSVSLKMHDIDLLRKWAARFGREAYPDYEDKFGEGHYLALTNASRMMHEEANRIEQEQAK
jgi:hypothetical protein